MGSGTSTATSPRRGGAAERTLGSNERGAIVKGQLIRRGGFAGGLQQSLAFQKGQRVAGRFSDPVMPAPVEQEPRKGAQNHQINRNSTLSLIHECEEEEDSCPTGCRQEADQTEWYQWNHPFSPEHLELVDR